MNHLARKALVYEPARGSAQILNLRQGGNDLVTGVPVPGVVKLQRRVASGSVHPGQAVKVLARMAVGEQ